MRAAAVRLLACDTRLLAALVVQATESRALVAPLLEAPLVLDAGSVAGRLVLGPAAREEVHTVRARLQLDDRVHRSVEERPIVRDDDEAGIEPQQKPLQELEPVEVEVVRGLVEEVDVEAREQDRGQRRAALLAARERPDSPIEVDVEADTAHRRGRSRPELGRRLLTGASDEVVDETLPAQEIALLRQVADAQARRVEPDRAAVELFQAGERTEERRLAAAVGADDADPAAGRHRERDALENRVRAAVNRYVVCGKRAAVVLHGDLLIERQSARLCAGTSYFDQRSVMSRRPQAPTAS